MKRSLATLLLVPLLLILPHWTAAAAAEGTGSLSDQLGVMLQIGNMLPANNQFGGRAGEVDKEFALLENAGVKWTRDQIAWEQIEATKGQWNWSAADTMVAAAARHHVNLVWLVGNTAPWDSSNGQWNGVPNDLQNPNGYFVQYVKALVRRYHGSIHYWEIRNEPNLDYMWHGTNPDQYAVYLREAYRTIKAIDPGAHVLFGGLGGPVPQQTTWFKRVLDGLQTTGRRMPFDIVNFHIYGGEADNHGFHGADAVTRYLDDCDEKLAACMADDRLRDVPHWVTEFDYPANPKLQPNDPAYDHGPQSQADFCTDLFPRMLVNHPLRKVFWASLLDDYDDPGFESMGLIHSDKQHHIGPPHPAYAVLKEMLKRE